MTFVAVKRVIPELKGPSAVYLLRTVDAGVQPWTELPLWLPGGKYAGMARADTSRALAAGLTFRPVEETVMDTLAWDRTVDGERPTLAHEREQEILSAR